ncbi:MAG: UPF0149 family protein [Gammaproteobacteria bacterium]|nr:UPF0149 family protein [Gammaproteobacteria bacterium]
MSELDYDTITDALRHVLIPADAAEIHGAITASLCTLGAAAKTRWQLHSLPELAKALAAGDALAEDTQRLLELLFTQTASELASGEFIFTPLLPNDDRPLEQRVIALGHWCQGFLLGLTIGGIVNAQALAEDLAEFYHDLAEISQITTLESSEEDADEQAYVELFEYLKVGAMLFYEEFYLRSAAQADPVHLH